MARGFDCLNIGPEIAPTDRSVLTKFNLRDNILSVQIYGQPVFDKIKAFSVVAFDYSVGGRQISDLKGLHSSASESHQHRIDKVRSALI